MKKIRGVFRLLFFAAAAGYLIAKILWFNFWKGKDLLRAIRIRQAWSRRFLPAIGVRLQVHGTAPDFPCLVMCNHRSYLDPAILACDVVGMPVSKSEVASWPVVGAGARVSGTLFLQRENLQSRKYTLNSIAEAVKNGFTVILFPEGTTHAEPVTSALKRGGFQLAATNGIPIVPAALEYASTDDYWIGNDTFVPHFIRRFGEKNMRVAIRYGEAIRSDDAGTLLEQTKSWIDAQIPELRRELF